MKFVRNRLKLRILRDYESISFFCDDMNITKAHLCAVLGGRCNGSYKFWMNIQRVLNIPDEEMEKYRKLEAFENGKRTTANLY